MGRYTVQRRRAILVASVIDLETRLTDAALDMADKLIGGLFARARKARERRYVVGTKNVGRLMRLFHDTIEALGAALNSERDAFTVVDETVGWARLLRAQGEVKVLADLADEDPLRGAAGRYLTLRKFAPDLLEALEFKAARAYDPTLSAIRLLRDLNQSGKRDIPANAPMPFRKDWKRLISGQDQPNRRLYETAVFAALRDKLRSGDVWVEGSSNYRRFNSYLLPPAAVPAIAAELGLPATADEWLARRGAELDRRLKRFARQLRRGELEGVELRDGRLHIAPVKAATPPEAEALAAVIDTMLPRVRITELLHEVSRRTRFSAAFTNLRTGEACDNENALLAAILADATNLGLTRMATASQGVTRDQLIWIADAYIRPETYKAALARIINAHHALPIATIWGDGTTSSSDGQFFRSAKRGEAAGDINARYGHDPGVSFYTHLSDQHGPYSIKVMSATNHEAPYVLDGLLHHGTLLKIDTHYTDTGGASDHVFILCALLGFRFCPRLRDLPERKLACIALASTYPFLEPLLGQRIKTDIIREHWSETLRLAASLKAGIVAPSVMLRKLAAYRRQNQLDVRHVEKTRGLPPPEPARPRTPGAGADRTHAVHARLARKPGIAPTLPCRAQQEPAASFPRAGHLHLQTRPANKAGLPTAVPRRSSFVPPASTSSSPRSCSGTPPTSPTPSPISVRLNNRCPMHGSPIHRRSAGSTSASPAISCGSGPPRPQISAAPSISARRESLHDPRLSQSVRP